MTPRALVVRELARSGRFRSAQDLYRSLDASGARVSVATVYRTLRALESIGLVETTTLATSRTLCRLRPAGSGGPYLVCRVCGCAVAAPATAVEEWAQRVAVRWGFSEVEARIGLWGRCRDCLDENDSDY